MEGARGDAALSRRIGDAAMDLLWVLAMRCPAVVLEANFRTRSPQERAKLAALDGQVVEVHCRVPLAEASRRFAERARHERHHPAHPLAEMSPERMAEYAEPFAMSPVIEVDTTCTVDLEALVVQLNAAWPVPANPAETAGDLGSNFAPRSSPRRSGLGKFLRPRSNKGAFVHASLVEAVHSHSPRSSL